MMKNDSIKILLIEDDSTMREGIQIILKKMGYSVYSAKDGNEGSSLFTECNPDLVITDLQLPGKSGMHLLNEFHASSPALPIILISAYGTIDLAVNALKSGARDFISKPFSIDELKTKISDILMSVSEISSANGDQSSYFGMIGSSEGLINLKEQARQIAAAASPVLITGESGTGKELIARAIHFESDRRDRIFLAVNCGAFSDTILESELFGHEKGSFTGAIRQHKGIFEQANGGSILLDEIGEISIALQVKLLRVLQWQTFQRLGGSEEISTDVRIIAATNCDLKEAIRQKDFREDLYFRLNVLPIAVPPLRERREDIAALISHFVKIKCERLKRPEPVFDLSAIEKLQQYRWPGNIRELENLVERMLIFSTSLTITSKDIFFDSIEIDNTVNGESLSEVLESTEYRMIRDALAKAGGIKQKAARLLGIKTSSLYYKLDKYGIADSNDDG